MGPFLIELNANRCLAGGAQIRKEILKITDANTTNVKAHWEDKCENTQQ